MPRFSTVEFSNNKGSLCFRLLKGINAYDDDEMLGFVDLNLDPATLPSLDSRINVETYGLTLRKALEEHKAVGPELLQLFNYRGNEASTLKFVIAISGAGQFRWETLCDQSHRFLAVDSTCHLNRIAMGGSKPQETELRDFTGSITLAAFLSPSGVKSKAELDAIVSAVSQAREVGLNIEIIVYLGEQELLDNTLADIATGKLAGVRAYPMPATPIAIETALKNDKAQLLHFFCHGYAKSGMQLLEFASINDHDIAAPSGSIFLTIERLETVLGSEGKVWVTVLNSCSGAQAVSRLFSMANTLAKSASPVTIGMAEPIKDVDATLFAHSFYREALNCIAQYTGNLNVGGVTTIDFGPAVSYARRVLFDAAEAGAPNEFSRWCLPVLYLSDPPLKINRTFDPQMKARIDAIASALRGLPSNTPLELRDQLLAILDKPPSVPNHLRPDRFGNLP